MIIEAGVEAGVEKRFIYLIGDISLLIIICVFNPISYSIIEQRSSIGNIEEGEQKILVSHLRGDESLTSLFADLPNYDFHNNVRGLPAENEFNLTSYNQKLFSLADKDGDNINDDLENLIENISSNEPVSLIIHSNLDHLEQDEVSTTPKFTAVSGSQAPISIVNNEALATFIENEGLSGDGTYTSPYIIENFIINASTAHGIEILTTDAHLIIRNCTIEGGGHYFNGINLIMAVNVNISNNLLSNNNLGISMSYSSNNTLSGNNANNNNYYGILLGSSSNNTLSGNNASYNNYDGIYLYDSSNNTLSGNNASYNNDRGISLSYSCNNTLNGNNANNNNYYGIYLYDSCNNNILSRNNGNNNNEYGIYLEDSCNSNILSRNNASYNNENGIYLEDSNNNILTDNTANNNNRGIRLSSSSNNTLNGNNASYNNWNGICLESSSNNTLIGNNASYNNWNGICLESSSNNTLIGNIMFYSGLRVFGYNNNIDTSNKVNDKSVRYYENTPGVHLSGESDVGQVILVNCNDSIIERLYISEISVGITVLDSFNCTITENTVIDCQNGIYLESSSNNILTGNNASYNDKYGIRLSSSSNNNTLSGNNASYNNNDGISLQSSSNNNTLTGNNANNNGVGIYLDDSCNNTLSGNNASYNNDCGISLSYSCNNTFTGNNANYNNNDGIYLDDSCNNNMFTGNNANYHNFRGIYLDDSCNNNTLTGNNANNNGVGICLQYSSNNNTLNGNNANNNSVGIYLYSSCNNTLSGNNANNNNDGISLQSSCNNTLSGNNASYNNWDGIRLSSSCNNTLTGNNANNNNRGILLGSSSYNILTGNNANYNNRDGISLLYSCNNTLSGNIMNYNNWNGIYLWHSSNNNSIYFNDIYGNTNNQAFEDADCTDNQWDNGTTGNYWDVDYINNYPSATNDGNIWSIPYEINGDGNEIDHFPLVNGIITDFDCYKPQFTDIPEDFSDYEGYSNQSISWIVTDLYPATYIIERNGSEVVSATAWTDGSGITYNVPDGLLKGDYNITIIVTDESGNTAQDTVIFTANDGEIPQFTDIPEDFSDYEGYSDLSISWTATDLYPATYIIELNGIGVVLATAWTNGSAISYNIPDDLLKGDYNIIIIVTDESGNTALDTIIFTVISTETTTIDDTTDGTTDGTTDSTTDGTTDDTTDDMGSTTPGFSLIAAIYAGIFLLIRRRKIKKNI